MKQSNSVVQALALPVLVGFVLTMLLMAGCAGMILIGKVSSTQISMLSMLCLGLGSGFTAWIASNRAPGHRVFWGLGAGAGLFLCFALVSLAWLGQPVDWMRVLVNFAINLGFAFVGAVLGSSMKRKRYKNRKK